MICWQKHKLISQINHGYVTSQINYVGHVYDTSVTRDDPIESDDPNANFYRVDDWFTMNLAVSYSIDNNTALDGTRLRFAINNLFDEDPPLADETYGFFSDLHSARGRVFSVELRKRFR